MKRATVYFDEDLHQALKLKAFEADRSISDLVNDAVRGSLEEDRLDLKAVRNRSVCTLSDELFLKAASDSQPTDSLEFKRSVAKDVAAIPKRDLQRIMERIEALRDDPRPPGCVKLSGQEYYRIRQGNYRIRVRDHR